MKKNSIVFSKEQRHVLEQMVNKGTAPARKIKHAQVLLKIDESEHRGTPEAARQQRLASPPSPHPRALPGRDA